MSKDNSDSGHDFDLRAKALEKDSDDLYRRLCELDWQSQAGMTSDRCGRFTDYIFDTKKVLS